MNQIKFFWDKYMMNYTIENNTSDLFKMGHNYE